MPQPTNRILIVVTSHGELGVTGEKTGFYYEELAAPYCAFVDAGYGVDIASIKGGHPPFDPKSLPEGNRPVSVQRFLDDPRAMAKLENTMRIDDVDPAAYDAIYLPGGHGTMWDFPGSEALGRVVAEMFSAGKVVGAVCHGIAGLLPARLPDGVGLVTGRRVNAFTNAEEEEVGLKDAVPFLLESRLREAGARFEGGPNWHAYVVRDGALVTGQNPQSSPLVAEEMLRALREQGKGTDRLRRQLG